MVSVSNHERIEESLMSDPSLKPFDFDEVQVGAELGSYEYEFTQEMLDRFREAIDDRRPSTALSV